MGKLVRNESIKLFASWTNSISVAVIGAGAVAPFATKYLGLGIQTVSSDAMTSSRSFASASAPPYIWLRNLFSEGLPMTDGNFAVLFAPIFALVMVMATGLFVYARIMRHGRVFNWPPIPEKSSLPPAAKRGDK